MRLPEGIQPFAFGHLLLQAGLICRIDRFGCDAKALGELEHRLLEAQPLLLHPPADRVGAAGADMAVGEVLAGVEAEAGPAVLMPGATGEELTAHPPEAGGLKEIDDLQPLPDLLDHRWMQPHQQWASLVMALYSRFTCRIEVLQWMKSSPAR